MKTHLYREPACFVSRISATLPNQAVVQDAFRPVDLGHLTDTATSREDIVAADTANTSSQVKGNMAQLMSDSALGAVGGQSTSASKKGAAGNGNQIDAMPGSAMNAGSSFIEYGVMQVLRGGGGGASGRRQYPQHGATGQHGVRHAGSEMMRTQPVATLALLLLSSLLLVPAGASAQGIARCQCRKPRIQCNHIACAMLVWVRLTELAIVAAQSAYRLKHGLLDDYLCQQLKNPWLKMKFA